MPCPALKIDGAAMGDRGNQYGALPFARMGPSWRSGPYLAPRYRVGCWVKSENFTGTFAISADFIVYQKPREPKSYRKEIPISGKMDWTYVSFETDFPRLAHGWNLRLDPNGKGTVWVDDVEVTPLP